MEVTLPCYLATLSTSVNRNCCSLVGNTPRSFFLRLGVSVDSLLIFTSEANNRASKYVFNAKCSLSAEPAVIWQPVNTHYCSTLQPLIISIWVNNCQSQLDNQQQQCRCRLRLFCGAAKATEVKETLSAWCLTSAPTWRMTLP